MRISTATIVLGASALVAALGGCAVDAPNQIYVLAADESTQLQQPLDVEAFDASVEQNCDGCQVVILDAAGEAGAQAEQLDAALADGADLLVLDPVDPELADSLTRRAGEVPVVAYASQVAGADYFVGLTGATTPGDLPSDLDAARAVILGDEESFEFVPATAMSEQAAQVAVRVLAGEDVPDSEDLDGVPSWTFQATEVTLADLTSIVLPSGAMTLEDLCTGDTAKKCAKAGLT